MRRYLPIVWILSLGGCELYNLEDGLDLWLEIPPIVKTAQPEIKYEIRGAFDVELSFESLSNQATWIQENELTTKLSERSGSLRFSQPLKNTRYRILARPITRRNGNEIIMDEVIQENAMEVVLGAPTFASVDSLTINRDGSMPLTAYVVIKGTNIRPSAILAVIDAAVDPPLQGLLNDSNQPVSQSKFVIDGTTGQFVFGFGRFLGLDAGLEKWEFEVFFNCFPNVSFVSDGVNSFQSDGDTLYFALYNAGEATEFDLVQALPAPGSSLTSYLSKSYP